MPGERNPGTLTEAIQRIAQVQRFGHRGSPLGMTQVGPLVFVRLPPPLVGVGVYTPTDAAYSNGRPRPASHSRRSTGSGSEWSVEQMCDLRQLQGRPIRCRVRLGRSTY